MKVLITPRGFQKVGQNIIDDMRNKGIDVHYNDTGLAYDHETFKKLAKDADAIIVGVDKMDADLIKSCPKLKVICKFGVGTDNIDLEVAKEKNIYVGRTIGSNSRSVAEHVVALMFADSKNIYRSINEVKEGSWNKYTGSELEGKTVGIIGFGAIGKEVAKMCHGLGMNVNVFDMFDITEDTLKEYHAKKVEFANILETSDYLTLHVPLTEDTANMINYETMKTMKPNSCIINTARGGIVSEEDLQRALKEQVIKSAYFDVYSEEPPHQDDLLIKMNEFALTPHVAARTMESEYRTCVMSSQIILEQLGVCN